MSKAFFGAATHAELLGWLSKQTYSHVTGVHRIRKGNPAFSAALTIGTHGKEIIAGLEAMRWVLTNEDRLSEDIDLFVVIGNEQAATMALATDDLEARKSFRFTPGGSDLNRLPESPDLCSYSTYEHNRAWRLHAALGDQLSFILDLHTTDGKSNCAGLGIVGSDAETDALFSVFPVYSVFTGIGAVQKKMGTKTQPFSGFLAPKRLAVEVELGQHNDPNAMFLAPIIVENWLKFIGLGDSDVTPNYPKPMVARAVWSVMAPDATWQVAHPRLLEEFAPVETGDILLVKGQEKIVAPDKGVLVWGPDALTLSEADCKSEIFFALQQA